MHLHRMDDLEALRSAQEELFLNIQKIDALSMQKTSDKRSELRVTIIYRTGKQMQPHPIETEILNLGSNF